jgi:hypothetical protein
MAGILAVMFTYCNIGEAFTFEAGSKNLRPIELHGDDAGAVEDDAEVAGLPVQEVDDDLHARLPVFRAAILVGLEVGHVREGPLRRELHRSGTKQVY